MRVRACDDSDGLYTFWDYQAGGLVQRGQYHGIRIDHLLLSPRAADPVGPAMRSTSICALEKPFWTPHVPVSIDLN